MSEADIKDCFYECLVPESIGRHTSFDHVMGHELGDWGPGVVEGRAVLEGERIFPFLRVLAMGWSWAFWFVQKLHIEVLEHPDHPMSLN